MVPLKSLCPEIELIFYLPNQNENDHDTLNRSVLIEDLAKQLFADPY